MVNKYSEAELHSMLTDVKENGWLSLDRGEKIALSRYCRKHSITLPNAKSFSDSFARDVEANKNKPVYTSPSTNKSNTTTSALAEPVDTRMEEQTMTPVHDEPIDGQVLFTSDGERLGHFVDDITPIETSQNIRIHYYKTIATKLRDYPGKWLIMSQEYRTHKVARDKAHAIRSQRTNTWKADLGHYEAAAQHINGKYYVAVRYMPTAAQENNA